MSETNLDKLNRLQKELDELKDRVLPALAHVKSVKKLKRRVEVLEKKAAERAITAGQRG